jgi:5-methylcytosine-specific restriction endonuclease McrA
MIKLRNTDHIFIEKAKRLIKWLLLPENASLRRHTEKGYRSSKEYYDWRIAVLKRDKWECQECESKAQLEVHHIKAYKDFPRVRIQIDNGITLCKTCHKKRKRVG